MSKEKFLKSVIKSSDFKFVNNDALSVKLHPDRPELAVWEAQMDVPELHMQINELYEKYVQRTNKARYKYIGVLVEYLLFLACKMMKKNNTTKKPGLFEVCQKSYSDFLENDGEMYAYPEGADIQTILTDLCTKYLDQTIWEKFLQLMDEYKRYNENFFAAAMMFSFEKSKTATPAIVEELALEILCLKSGDKFMDLGCNTGNIMLTLFNGDRLARYTEDKYSSVFPGVKYYGYETSIEEREIAFLRAHLLGVYNVGEDFTNVDSDYHKGISDTNRFDKIFANYPRGLKYLPYNLESKGGSNDWAFNDWICKHLTSNGKAVAIMSNGAAWNTVDIKNRKEFVEKGLIEAVIELPAGIFPNSSVATTMIVFSHGNKSIKMVEKTDYDIMSMFGYNERILEGLNSDTEYSKTVSITELRNNDYVLNYNRYITPSTKFKNCKKLGDFIISIRRGISRKKAVSGEKVYETFPVPFLELSNIKNGLIDDELIYLPLPNEITQSDLFTKVVLKENDLIISKSGEPYKIAVFSKPQTKPLCDEPIVPSDNMYVIELDTNRINPYYVKVFLESQQGKALLNSRSNQATIINISRKELENLEIPVPPLSVQNKIAEAYLARADEYKVCQLKLEDATNRLNSVFDDNYKD